MVYKALSTIISKTKASKAEIDTALDSFKLNYEYNYYESLNEKLSINFELIKDVHTNTKMYQAILNDLYLTIYPP